MRVKFYLAVFTVLMLAIIPIAGCGTSDGDINGDEGPKQEFFGFNLGFCQFHFQQFGPHSNQPNTPFGGLTIFHDLPPGPYFFNCAIELAPTQHQWQLRNVPIFGHGEPAETYLPISWEELQQLTVQLQVQMVMSGHQLSKFPLLEPPPPTQLLPVNPYNLNYGLGIDPSAFEPLPAPGELPFLFDIPTTDFPTITFECGMHAKFTNQECGLNECCPAAVSNSLKTIGVSVMPGPMNMPPGGALEISDMKPVTGWTAAGVSPTWYNTKGPSTMASHGVTTTTEAVAGGAGAGPTAARVTTICNMLAAIKAGKDVEMQNSHHIAMVTGIYKLTIDGVTTYSMTVAHDTDQGNPGGLVNETLDYDPATNTLSGGVAGFFPGTAPAVFTVETKP